MFNFTTTMRQALLALTLAATTLAAQAGVIPTYHVTINTAVASGTSGVIDLAMDGLAGSPSAMATISNLQGAFGAIDGSVSHDWDEPTGGTFTMPAVGPSYLSFMADFGGMFSFDLAFSGDFLTTPSDMVSVFTVFALDGVNYLSIGGMDFVAQFELFTPTDTAGPFVGFTSDTSLANVAAIPEPSELLLMLTGLALIGLLTRRRFIR